MAKTNKIKMIRTGALTVEFLGANLGAIKFGGVEVLRGISYLVRDESWGTVPAKISAYKIVKSRAGTTIRYAANAATLTMKAQIEVKPRELVFTVRTTPSAAFKTNRTGFVVLHPAGAAGKPLIVTHTDGTCEKARFPKLISPEQPFFEIRALEHDPAPGLKARVLMEGNKFEMEDQRNWSDASFKTYVCSLLDPWPYELVAGEEFEQKVTLAISGNPPLWKKAKSAEIDFKGKLPEIGFAVPVREARATLKRVGEIKVLQPSHLLCVMDGTKGAAKHYRRLANETGVPIALEIILPAKTSADEEMRAMADEVQLAGLRVESIVVTHAHDLKSFQPDEPRPWGPTYVEMAVAARTHFPGVKVGGGMISFFTELNRKRPPAGIFDFITHSICPIVHDASDAAVMQTLETLPTIFSTTRSYIGKAPYHLGPSTIGARMNPYGVNVVPNPMNRRICLAANDPRQANHFAVNWNQGLIAAATKAKLNRITLSAITGPQGLIDKSGRKSPLFNYFRKLAATSR